MVFVSVETHTHQSPSQLQPLNNTYHPKKKGETVEKKRKPQGVAKRSPKILHVKT